MHEDHRNRSSSLRTWSTLVPLGHIFSLQHAVKNTTLPLQCHLVFLVAVPRTVLTPEIM